MKYLIFSLLSVSALILINVSQVFAGGGNVMFAPLNQGVAKVKGVEIIVTIFEPSKNKLDWPELDKYAYDVKGYEPVGVKDLELELEFVNPAKNQYCKMKDGGKTNEYGQTRATCYSDTVGQFVVETRFKTDKPLYEGGPSSKNAIHGVSIGFENKITSPPSPTPTPPVTNPGDTGGDTTASETAKKLVAVEQQNELQKKQIEELTTKVQKQEKEVSALKKVVAQIQNLFKRWFR